MVRYANRSRTGVSVPKGSTPCVTHHFPAGSLHAPYDLLSPLVIGKVMIKARPGQDIGPLFSKSGKTPSNRMGSCSFRTVFASGQLQWFLAARNRT